MTLRSMPKGWLFLGSVVFVLFFQWWSRFSGAPVVDFVVDDWRLWSIAQACDSLGDALMQAVNWPDRPLGTGIMIGTYYLLGDFIPGYVILESLYTALYLLAGLWAVYALTRDALVMLAFGLVFSLLPNLTESFQWHTMTVSYGLGFAAYLAATGAWIHYLKTGRWAWLAVASGCFAFALGSYEAGILLPAAWMVLGKPENRRQLWAGAVAFGLVVILYLVWKFTDGLGTLETRLFPHRGFSPEWAGFYWNAKETVRWWMGSHMLKCIANGLDGFLTLSSFAMRLVTGINVLLVAAAVLWMNRVQPREAQPAAMPFSWVRLVVFGLVWAGVTNVLTLFSWNAGRMNYLPGVGISLLIALVCRRRMKPGIAIGIPLLMLICLMANQGTSAQWRDAGVFHRRMYEHLQHTSAEWRNAQVVLFDTSGLRNRLTRGLLAVEAPDWGSYGNAVLMRGAFMKSMAELAVPGHAVPQVLLDVEHGAHIEGDVLHWHGWYDPADLRSIAMTNVYRIDCQQVALRRSDGAP